MLFLNFWFFKKKSHIILYKEAVIWSVFWIRLWMVFSVIIYLIIPEKVGLEKFSEFQSYNRIDKVLTEDDFFVIALVFGFFNLLREYHYKVLFKSD
jgi:tellurite resistance protein TerC